VLCSSSILKNLWSLFRHFKIVLVGFLSASLSLVLQIFKPYDFCFDNCFQIQKIFKPSLKTWSGSMYTLCISQGLKFDWYEILQQAWIENYVGIKFYSKLKIEIKWKYWNLQEIKTNRLSKKCNLLANWKTNSLCLPQELELVFTSLVLEFWF
jgi:hypothetical protein